MKKKNTLSICPQPAAHQPASLSKNDSCSPDATPSSKVQTPPKAGWWVCQSSTYIVGDKVTKVQKPS